MNSFRPSRRDFIKLASLLPLSLLQGAIEFDPMNRSNSVENGPGVIILVLDSLSASNLPFHGYRRKTAPNLERFAERAYVYHAHYSPSNFTTPGTASLLTGTYPWTHRAFHYEGKVIPSQINSNIFKQLGDYYSLAFSQNAWADLLLYQFSPWLDTHINSEVFNATNNTSYNDLFSHDPLLSFKGVESFAFSLESPLAGSSLLALLRKIAIKGKDWQFARQNSSLYPFNAPETLNDTNSLFRLEDLFDGLISLAENFAAPGLAYLHVYPPHYPYAPSQNAFDVFEDGWKPIRKGQHSFSEGIPDEELDAHRQLYDAYIYTLDAEFGRLLDFFDENGIFENNYVIVTSDHGELFERGEHGHTTPLLYEPLVHIPLIISTPAQNKRYDINIPTSSVDVVPTLLSLFGLPLPAFCEGRILPGLGGEFIADRPIYFIDSKATAVHGPIKTATFGMRKGRYKAIHYFGYGNFEARLEVYDLETDPEELTDLSADKVLANQMQNELDSKLDEINLPYVRTEK